MNVLTVIPAKLGSTRLPRKNILPFGGKPLVNWTIEAALESGVCGTVMVSTESEEVAEVARAAGAEVPFMRPEYLGRDPYEVNDVSLHVLRQYAEMGQQFDVLVTLLPTSPLRIADDIRGAVAVYRDQRYDFVVSVSRFECDVFCAHSMEEDGALSPLLPELFRMSTCDRPTPYEINGAVMVANARACLEQETLCGDKMHGYVMPSERSVDIDTPLDLAFAKFLLEHGKGGIDG